MPCASERTRRVDRGRCAREPRVLPQCPSNALQSVTLLRMPCVPSDVQGAMLRVSPLGMPMTDGEAPRRP